MPNAAEMKTDKPLNQMPAYRTPIGNCTQVKNCSLPLPKRALMAWMEVTTRIWRKRGAKKRKLMKKPKALA